jgi:hypothetical protein
MIPEPWSAVVLLVIGAGLAGVSGAIGGSLQAGREHDRWVRQSRMEAYSEFLVAIDALENAVTTDWLRVVFERPHELEAQRGVIADAERRFGAAVSRVYLLGPEVVRNAAMDSHSLLLDRTMVFQRVEDAVGLAALALEDDEQRMESRGLLLALMNRSIGIGPRQPFRRRFRRVE